MTRMIKRGLAGAAALSLAAAAVSPLFADDDHKVTICHKGKNEISVDFHAVPAHLAHGDNVGPCGAPGG